MHRITRKGLALTALILWIVLSVWVTNGPSSANAQAPLLQQRTPIPLATRVPPTLVPPPPPPTATPPVTQSAVARIKADGFLRVGIPYNIGRFATLVDTGDVSGFEADLANAIAEDWGTKVKYQQVTRLNGMSMLLSGQIDLLMGQVMIAREDLEQVDFSDVIIMNRQVALVNNDAPQRNIRDLGGQPVGAVTGSRGESAFVGWMQANGLQTDVKRYVMLDDGIQALLNKEVVALVGDRWELDQRVRNIIQGMRLLEGTFRLEPYAIAMRRYDASLRTLVNRTLQRLVQSKRLDPIYDLWFPKDLIAAEDRIFPRVWKGLDTDDRLLEQFPNDLVMPAQPVLPRLKAGQPIRVAGLGALPDSSGKPPILDAFNQALVSEMGRRWGVQFQIVPDSYGKAEDVLASGNADLAVGLEPKWDKIDRVDYVGIYAQHAYRIVVPQGSSLKKFEHLFSTNRQFGYFADDPEAAELAKTLAPAAGMRVETLKPRGFKNEQDMLQALVGDRTANLIFGDSLKLHPFVQANSKLVQMPDGDYGSPKAVSFAVPRNDVDFRLLIDVTLQDMYRDGTYQQIWKDTFGLGEPLSMMVWPGPPMVFGVKTGK